MKASYHPSSYRSDGLATPSGNQARVPKLAHGTLRCCFVTASRHRHAPGLDLEMRAHSVTRELTSMLVQRCKSVPALRELQPNCAGIADDSFAATSRDGDAASLPSVTPLAAAVLPPPAESAVMSAVPARARPQADQMPRLSRSPAASEMRGVSMVVA